MIGIPRVRLVGAQRGHELEAVEAGHHHVADDHIGALPPRRRQRRVSVADGFDW